MTETLNGAQITVRLLERQGIQLEPRRADAVKPSGFFGWLMRLFRAE